jgi:hypothetical protein
MTTPNVHLQDNQLKISPAGFMDRTCCALNIFEFTPNAGAEARDRVLCYSG